MEEEIIIVIKPKRVMEKGEAHSFATAEEAYLFLGDRIDRKTEKE